ncbi:unnamed protein product [Rhizoctonia solani]|uniref:Uncharacterized protein n=1 Tax=Rhizoctonia solani TaxID=456999 RepID=A0A8H3C8Z8_9AGAM|nr:unnamed protein product [Rhizoctonia solani]
MRQLDKAIVDQVKKKEIPMPKDVCHRLLYEEAAFTLDRLDVKHEPYESAGRFSPWNLLEFVPSTRLAQAQNGPEMTHWPNPFKPRGVYRRSATDPVYIHASVVNFLTTKGGSGYKPNVAWRGFEGGEFPLIESFEGNPITKPKSEKEKATLISVLRLDWNETSGMWGKAKNSVASFGGSVGKFVGFGSSN